MWSNYNAGQIHRGFPKTFKNKSNLMTWIHVVCFGLLSHVVCICNMYSYVHFIWKNWFDCLISNICNNLSVIIYKLMLHVVLICIYLLVMFSLLKKMVWKKVTDKPRVGWVYL